MTETDLESRILALLDGELPAEETAAIEQALLTDESARKTYEELVLLHNALECRFVGKGAAQQAGVVPVERLIAEQRGRLVRFSLLAAAAVLMISATVMWAILAPYRPPAVGLLRTSPGSLFTLTYEGRGKAPEGNQLVEGSVVRLAEGTLEGVFENGVRLVAEGPCTLRFLSGESVFQDQGRAWYQVVPAATGFTVRTPELVAVDLGTEFGVVVQPPGPDEVHVLKGAVEVTARRGDTAGRTLGAGSAVQAGPGGGLLAIEAQSSRFRKQLAVSRPIPVANHSFEDDVLPRDGLRTTKETGSDDYDKERLPSGWSGFDDGEGGTVGTRGILSTAPDSYFSASLAATPDADANDQVYFSAARDLYQVLPATLEPDSTYVLTVDIGDRAAAGGEGAPGSPGIHLGFGEVPGENLLTPAAASFPTQMDGGWVTWSVVYKTGPDPEGAGQPLRIELTSGSRVGWFDRVRLSVSR